ncbi:MAG: helix-turn-helix transcriptional regulator [Chitinophagaceae bacterium]|nr:helix-turn-helix transcriptional regulator [Chitinophagaceae bacterium]
MFVSTFFTVVSPFSGFVSIFSTIFLTINPLSMLSFNLAPVFKARSIDNPYTFLVKAGIARHTAHRILSRGARVFRLNHVELICRVLICEPNDILVYTPAASHPLPDDHPLHNLRHTGTTPNVKETLSTIPFKQLQQLASQISGSV